MSETQDAAAQSGADEEAQPTIPGIIKPPSGQVPTFNQKADAPTIFIDAVQGAMLTNLGVKISFLEHFVTDDFEIRGKYVLNLAMSGPQMRAVGELFVKMSDDMDKALADAD